MAIASKSRWMDDQSDSSPLQKARQLRAAQAIRDGEIEVPFRCGWCQSKSVEQFGGLLRCLQCGKETTMTTARTLRRQRIRAIISKGIDIDVRKKEEERGHSH